MATEPLDAKGLAAAADGPWAGAPEGTVVGHVHLRVGDMAEAEAFYTGTLGLAVMARYPGAIFLATGGYHHHVGANAWDSRGAGARRPAATGLAELVLSADPGLSLPSAATDPWGTAIRVEPRGARRGPHGRASALLAPPRVGYALCDQGDPMLGQRFATRLNSFASRREQAWPGQAGAPSVLQMAERAATVAGLTDLDLNFPDHVGPDQVGGDPAALAARLSDLGLEVNGLAMRFYTNPAFKLGAFTHPDRLVRREAIDLTRRGIDAARAAGARLMTLWLGQDGFDYSFQADYARLWADEVEGIREVAAHDPDCLISIEYKPNEPRAHALLKDLATTLLALADVGAANTGVTLDFAHVLYAGEVPAQAASMVARRSRLLGVHLNDGYGKRDDGLMVGSVHLQATLELLWQLERDGWDGAIYFDTFPDASGLDPVAECAANIAAVRRLMAVARRLAGDNALAAALEAQDAVVSQGLVGRALAGG